MNRQTQIHKALLLANTKTDFHISEIKRVCRVPKGRYEDREALAIIHHVKAVAPMDIWTVWERPGWQTSAATFEVRLLSFFKAAQANATRIMFLALILERHRRGDQLTGLAHAASRMAVTIKEMFEGMMPSPDREDSTLARIDRRIADGEGQ